MINCKIINGRVRAGGKSYGCGEIVELSEMEALRLVDLKVIEIKENQIVDVEAEPEIIIEDVAEIKPDPVVEIPKVKAVKKKRRSKK
jgi:hypothetical protein